MAKIPHFAIPFRITAQGAVTHEQDSEEEIMDCIETILRYEKGQRPEKPEFGIVDQTFEEPQVDISKISADLAEFEPRLDMTISRPVLDKIDQLVTSIRVERQV